MNTAKKNNNKEVKRTQKKTHAAAKRMKNTDIIDTHKAFNNKNYGNHAEGMNSAGRRKASEKSRRDMRRRKRKHDLITGLFSLAACLVIVFILLITTTVKTNADVQDLATNKYYKTVHVEAGDTLWSIAEENMTAEYDDIHDYIKEIKAINNMIDSRIYADQNICVPYYE